MILHEQEGRSAMRRPETGGGVLLLLAPLVLLLLQPEGGREGGREGGVGDR
jgi:hypothetical protein